MAGDGVASLKKGEGSIQDGSGAERTRVFLKKHRGPGKEAMRENKPASRGRGE